MKLITRDIKEEDVVFKTETMAGRAYIKMAYVPLNITTSLTPIDGDLVRAKQLSLKRINETKDAIVKAIENLIV